MVRNIPDLALIPLVILWFGIDESAKRSGNCSSARVTNRMACRSRCEIQVQASHRLILTACSRLSTARNQTVWDLGCRSAGRLSKRMTDDCGRVLTCHLALSLASLRRLIRPPHGVPLRTMSVKPQWRPNSATQRDDAMCRRPKSVTSRSPVRSTAGRLRHGDRAIWLAEGART